MFKRDKADQLLADQSQTGLQGLVSLSQDETMQKEDHDAQNIEDANERVRMPASSL